MLLGFMKTYASFFEFHDKPQKELGVVEELIAALNSGTKLGLHSPREFVPDPPDCVCLDASGQAVAIEVAEVVCQEAAHKNAKGLGLHVYREWKPGDITEYVARKLSEKDQKTFHGGPYRSIIACLFTDEPVLSFSQAETELKGNLFGPFSQLTAAYLLLSYQPSTKTYPVLELGIHK